jgi:general stress protein YciG
MTDQATNTTGADNTQKPARRRCGFAAMSPERVREISRLGGKAAHEKGVAHEFTREEAQAAGRKGGLAAHQHDAQRREAHANMNMDANANQEQPQPREPEQPAGGEPRASQA